jgi:lipid-A-disaccharide synthase
MKRILVSAGDPSGDLLLSKIIEHVHAQAPGAYEFVGLCGPHCEAQGVKAIAHSHEVAVVGLFEVLKNLRRLFGVLDRLTHELDNVHAVLCVDFPDFNFRLARLAKKKGKPVDWIVAPQVWAWRSGRVVEMKTLLRRLYPVLPFEQSLFREHGIDARYLGHPLRDILPPRSRRNAREMCRLLPDEIAIAVLPGSRQGEIARTLPILVRSWEIFLKQMRRRHDERRFRAVLPLAPGVKREDLNAVLNASDLEKMQAWIHAGDWLLADDAWTVLQAADFGWVTSGTATLEAAYYQLPHVLVYKLNALSAMIIKSMTTYFTSDGGAAGLPNILLEKPVIPELLQGDLSPARLAAETVELLSDGIRMASIRRDLKWIPKKLGEAGSTARIAEDLLGLWS